MDYKELLKKYWFVALIGIVLFVFIGIYAADAYKNRELVVSEKQIDGQYAVYSIDGEYVFADDFYDSLFTQSGLNCEIIQFQREILNKAYENTDEIESTAANYSAYMLQTYGEEYCLSQLKQMGYTNGIEDLSQYYIDSQKRVLLVTDYVKSHEADIITPYKEENDPRLIYHILVKVADISTEVGEDGSSIYTANPTEEEKAKLDNILAALKTKSFQDVALEYSDDSSGQLGGLIGVISNANSSNYYPIFSKTSLALKDDEVSEVITSQAGYHIIWNAGSSTDTLLTDQAFLSSLEDNNPVIGVKAMMDKSNELGYEIVDQELLNMINAQLESEVGE